MLSEKQFMDECRKRNVTPFKPSEGTPNKPMHTTGFVFNTPAGGTTDFDCPLGGDVSELLGIVVMDAASGDSGTLKINQAVLLQNTSLAAFNPERNIYKNAQYYKLPRKLTGSDTVTLTVQSAAAHPIFIVFYLLPK